MIAALALLLASAQANATPTDQPYHVYEIPAPAQSGVYRMRVSDEAARLWAIEQIQTASMFDNNGQRLSCELLRSSRYGRTKKTYPLTGQWHDLEKKGESVKGYYGPLNFAWRFSVPTLAENERIAGVRFDWRSKVSNPGEVRYAEIPPLPYNRTNQPPPDTLLRGGQSDPSHGHASLGMPIADWIPETPTPAEAQLLFTLSQDELTIESPTLETLTKKPWTLQPVGGPGWILFAANGNAPYRLQLGDTLYGCSQGLGNNVDEVAATSDPEWPPEITIGAEIANAPHLGETGATWNRQLDQRVGEKARGNWLTWGVFAAIAFIVGFFIALSPPKR